MTVWFIISVIKKRNDIADVAWGLGFIFLAWLSFALSKTHTVVSFTVNILVTIWGLRLASHIYQRNKNKKEDYRYAKWRDEWKQLFYIRSYLQVFVLQGILLFIIALPIVFINRQTIMPDLFGYAVGALVWIFGFAFETAADSQLKQFVRDPGNKGKILQGGLWKYSRHPNYFGEVTQWWGIFIIAAMFPHGYMTICGPLTITFLILFVSGIPLLENKYKARKDFEEYKRKTSIFIPLPPAK